MLFSDSRQAPAETLACSQRDYPEWHKGRQHYAVWLLEIEQEDVLQRLQQARHHLSPWLLDSQRQAHITLAVAGFLVDQPRYNDDACPLHLDSLRRQLREQPPRTFSLTIGGLDSFASAAFLDVGDTQQQLSGLRQQLARGNDFRNTPYLPHLTVGLYGQRLPAAQVQAQLQAFTTAQPLRLFCSSLSLCHYQAEELQGPLHCIERFALESDQRG